MAQIFLVVRNDSGYEYSTSENLRAFSTMEAAEYHALELEIEYCMEYIRETSLGKAVADWDSKNHPTSGHNKYPYPTLPDKPYPPSPQSMKKYKKALEKIEQQRKEAEKYGFSDFHKFLVAKDEFKQATKEHFKNFITPQNYKEFLPDWWDTEPGTSFNVETIEFD